MTRALPGKYALPVPASLRNPQHFHRLCTGLVPLRTSHPHVCAQTAGKRSCRRLAGSSGSARAPVLAGPAFAPRASVRDTLVPSPAFLLGRTDVRRAHVVRRWVLGRVPGCALVGTDMIKVLANRNTTRGRWLPNSRQSIDCCGILVSAGAESRYLCDAGQ